MSNIHLIIWSILTLVFSVTKVGALVPIRGRVVLLKYITALVFLLRLGQVVV